MEDLDIIMEENEGNRVNNGELIEEWINVYRGE